jgi:hypothetical protein
MSLAELQRLLYRLITAPGSVEEAVTHEPELQRQGLEALIDGNQRLSAERRLGIYANAYFYRLRDILKEDFPCTYAVLGDSHFHNLITGYLLEFPPSEPSVLHAGARLPHYLQTMSGRAGVPVAQLPFLSELARLERVCTEVFHAANAEALEHLYLRDLAPESWPALRIRLHPAAQMLDTEWRVDRLMTEITERQRWQPAQRESATILVWRHHWQVRYRALERGERAGLRVATPGADFAAVCAAIANELESTNFTADIAIIIRRILTGWLGDGILISA